jgi:O-antigen ligase
MKGVVFTYLLTYGGAAVSLFDPFIGLLVYVCFAILRPEYLWFWAFEPGNNFSRVIGVALLAGWVVREFRRWRADPNKEDSGSPSGFVLGPVLSVAELLFRPMSGTFGRARPIVAALVAAWLWSLFSAALAPNQPVARDFIEYFSKIVLPFIIGMFLIESMSQLKQLAWVIVLSQGYVALEMNLAYFDGYNRLYWDGFGSMDNNSASIAMVTCLGPAFMLGLYSERWWQKAVAFGCAAVLCHAVLFSFSRGGMLAMILTAVAILLVMRPSLTHYALLGVGVVIGLQLAGAEVRDRFMTLFAGEGERDASAQSRIELWTALWDVIQKMPVFGAGPDHWPLMSDKYGFAKGKEGHSLWIQWAAEMGVPGLVFLALFYLLPIWRLWPLARDNNPATDPWLRHVACMVIVALVGFAVSAQFVSLKLLEVPYYVVLLGAGALKLATAPATAEQPVTYNVMAVPGSV